MRSRLTRGAAAVVAAALAPLTLGLVLLLHARLGAAVDDVLRQCAAAAGALVVLEWPSATPSGSRWWASSPPGSSRR